MPIVDLVLFFRRNQQQGTTGDAKISSTLHGNRGPFCRSASGLDGQTPERSQGECLKQFVQSLCFEKKKPETVWLHDWLSYSFYRNNNFKWVIDDMPHMYYRQHSRNEVGANLNIKSMLFRVKILLSDNVYDFVIKQAEFLNQNNLKPIMLINFKTRSAFFKLSMMSYKFRRKKIEKFLCMLFFMYKFRV